MRYFSVIILIFTSYTYLFAADRSSDKEIIESIKKFNSFDDEETVIKEIVSYGDIAIPHLIEYVNLARHFQNSSYSECLARLNAKEAVPALIKSLRDPRLPFIAQKKVVEVLGRLGEAEAVPILQEILASNPQEDYRREVLNALGNIGESKSIKVLEQYIENEDAADRLYAISQLRRLESLHRYFPDPKIKDELNEIKLIIYTEKATYSIGEKINLKIELINTTNNRTIELPTTGVPYLIVIADDNDSRTVPISRIRYYRGDDPGHVFIIPAGNLVKEDIYIAQSERISHGAGTTTTEYVWSSFGYSWSGESTIKMSRIVKPGKYMIRAKFFCRAIEVPFESQEITITITDNINRSITNDGKR